MHRQSSGSLERAKFVNPAQQPMMVPEARIAAIEDSLRCFAFAWLSFIPLVGAAFAILAFRLYSKASVRSAGHWNPASAYAKAGSAMAGIGGLLSALEFGGLMLSLWNV